jgi:hypothetical protein
MKYIYDEEIKELRDYVDKCSERQAKDTKAFLEILRLTEDEEIGAFEALIKIASICKERLKE